MTLETREERAARLIRELRFKLAETRSVLKRLAALVAGDHPALLDAHHLLAEAEREEQRG
jgi:hypothetical protein